MRPDRAPRTTTSKVKLPPRPPMIESLERRTLLAADFDVLVFSRTTGWRHDSIEPGIQSIRDLGAANNFSVAATEDPVIFTDAGLAPFEAVVFLNTTSEVLDNAQQAAFERFIRSGNGWVGTHSAADTEYLWPWYGGLVGAYFVSHPAIQSATIEVADRVHPATAHLPQEWVRTDEWYNFRANPRANVHVLMTLDEGSYDAGANAMGYDHPIAWCQNYDGGRSFYTGIGHTRETFSEPAALQHILGGIRFAAGVAPGDCTASVFNQDTYRKTIIDADTNDPFQMDIADDGRVFYIERGGAVKLYDPPTLNLRRIGTIPVVNSNEDGLMGIALDPNFQSNNWIYLFYSATTAGQQHLSRFTYTNGVLDMSSEEVLLTVPVQRTNCCHSAGALDFGPDGTLYLSTGDNTNPFDSNGFAPIDERTGRSDWDAQKSSSNTNDLRGKILRIKPESDGTYSIPAGNLFPANGSQGRPEIYTMGNRNPFRFSVDQETGWLYWGDVGPDAVFDSPNRGPRGYDEVNQAKSAGNYGWPYFVGNNQPYLDYDFATGVSGPAFNPNAPVNNSPNNTGATNLPPARPAWIWYPYAPSPEFPELGSAAGRTAMAGPVYHYNASTVSPTGLPAYYDDALFFYDWARGYMREVKIDAAGNVLQINPFIPHLSTNHPMDVKIAPDGSMYIIEWGSGFGGGNADSQLVRIDYVRNLTAPAAVAGADQNAGPAPLTVNFTSTGTDPGEPGPVNYAWDFDADGEIDSAEPHPTHTYTTPGEYSARLIVTNSVGLSSLATVRITVGNTAPVLTLVMPPDGSFFTWGQHVPYAVTIASADGTPLEGIPASHIVVQPFMGHNDHSHPLLEYHGYSGVIPVPAGHGDNSGNLFLVLEARYADDGGSGGTSPVAGRSLLILNPRRKQAEHFSDSSDVLLNDSADADGGLAVGGLSDGDYISFKPVNLRNIDQLRYRLSNTVSGATIEVRADSPTGPLLASANIASTGGTYVTRNDSITDPGGTHELFFVFKGTAAALANLKLNWIEFDRANNTPPTPAAETYKTAPGKPLNVPRPYGLLSNDADDQADLLFAAVATAPAHGQLSLHPDGSFTYAPDADYAGPDTFTYFAHDGASGSLPTTVTIDVTHAMGDANADGRINADDYFRIDQAFLAQPQNPGYAQGDFNYDGRINADDYFLIDRAFLRGASALALAAAPSDPVITSEADVSRRATKRRVSTGGLFSETRVRRRAVARAAR